MISKASRLADLLDTTARRIVLSAGSAGDSDPDALVSLDDVGDDLPVTEDPRDIAFRTSKSGGFMRRGALTPRVVENVADPSDKILDFGAGAGTPYTLQLRQDGLDVKAYDFGASWTTGLDPTTVDTDPFHQSYDLTFASNVINVSSSRAMLIDTLEQIRSTIKPGGTAIFNYPKEPRKWRTSAFPKGVPAKYVRLLVEQVFGHFPVLLWGSKSEPVWQVGA